MTPVRRELIFLVCATLSVGGCDGPSGSSGQPTAAASVSAAPPGAAAAAAVTRAVITMDEAHDATKKDGLAYTIAPSSDLVIELGPLPRAGADAAAPAEPNAVHVVHGAAAYYRAAFTGKGPVTLNTASLDAVKGGAFPGFEAGEQYLVAVGTELPSADGAMRFAPAWTTKVMVSGR